MSGSERSDAAVVGRRAALVGLGLTGVMASAAALAPSANAATPGQMLAVTLADLRGTITPSTDIAYYVVDPGHEGMFRYDPADTTSPDDLGLVLVSSGGHRFKRSFQGPIRLSWFGAKADYNSVTKTGTPADAALTGAIAAQARYATRLAATGGYRTSVPVIEFDAGNYLLTKKKFAPTWYPAILGMRFAGAGMYQTNVYFNCPEATNGTDNHLFHNSNNIRGLRIDGISFFGVSDTERFLYYSSTGTASTTYFRDCSWHSFKVGFDIQGAANTSENRFQNCHIKTWSPGSVFYNSNNAQSVNNSFIDCEFEVFKGIALKYVKGGVLNVLGGSIIPFDAGTFLHIEDPKAVGVGSQNGTFNLIGIKPEIRQTSKLLVMDAPECQVTIADTWMANGHGSHSPRWADNKSYAVGTTARFGPLFSQAFRCTVAHTSSAGTKPLTGADWETVWEPLYELSVTSGSLTIRGGALGYRTQLNYVPDGSQQPPTRASMKIVDSVLFNPVADLVGFNLVGQDASGPDLPRVSADGCRPYTGFWPAEYGVAPGEAVDVSLNFNHGHDGETARTKVYVYRGGGDRPTGLPTQAGDVATFRVPRGATITGVHVVTPGTVTQPATYQVTNHDGSVVLWPQAPVNRPGIPLAWHQVRTEAERVLRVSTTGATSPDAYVVVEYI